MKRRSSIINSGKIILSLMLVFSLACEKEKSEVIPELEFGTFSDSRDGQIYKTIKIGTQTWFAENLNYEILNSRVYNDLTENGNIYGRLYSHSQALSACPEGWRLPTDEEVQLLFTYLGGEAVAGGKLKATGTEHWIEPNRGATNESGFTALGAGIFSSYFHEYMELHENATFWTSTLKDDESAYTLFLSNDVSIAEIKYFGAWHFYSVRCIKN